jgi:hypothetical protein
MKRLLFWLLPAVALFALAADAGRVAGVDVSETLESGGTLLTLNGAGIRTRVFLDVYAEEIDDGDVFELVYLPEQGLNVYKNGSYTTTIACGLSFKRALFGIWLSDRPVQTSLKRGLLGR